jgi:hypothetical protein
MPPAIIGGVIAGVGAVGAAALGASAQKNASRDTTRVAQDTARESNALTRDIYNQNKGILSPYVNQGYAATNALSGLLGLPANNNTIGTLQPQPNALGGFAGGQGYDAHADLGFPQEGGMGVLAGYPLQPGQAQPTQQQPSNPYQAAFDNYRASIGYQFRMGEGMKGLNASFAARGLSNSGTAAKAALNYGQNIASDEFGRYLGYLGQQQQVGFGAGSALAGVGQNFAGTVSANNNNAATAAANGALASGAATAGVYGAAAGALGRIGGGYMSSYGGRGALNAYGVQGDNIY